MAPRPILSGLLLATALLMGCASQEWNGYVGQSVTAPSLRYGPPTQVYDLPDGRRAYQWRVLNDTTVVAEASTTEITLGDTTLTSSSTEYDPATQECFYTLIAEKRGNDWIATSFQQPRFECV